MADYDKLVERFFQKQEKVLDADNLKNILIQEYRKKLIEAAKQTQERVLKLPKLQISENWGKENTVERAELERIVDTATRGKVGPFEKLAVIQEQMTKLSAGELGKVKNPRRILSQIMILETMNRLFKSFQPSPAGFINEALLSVFYAGFQTAAGKANIEKDIGDVTDPDGIPISIKTKGTGGLIVDGSIENLYTSINRAGKVYFDIYEKTTEGKGGKDSHVGSLKVSRFYVDANNINTFLGKEYFDIVDGKLVPKAQFKKGGKEIDTQQNLREAVDKEKIVQTIINSQRAFSEEEMNNLLATAKIGPVIFKQIKNAVVDLAQKQKDPNKLEIIKQNISVLANIELSKRELEKDVSSGLEREFHVSEDRWRPFSQKQKFITPIVLTFSDDNLTKLLESAVAQIDKQIVEIFNNLDGFSNSISAYLTSLTKNRNAIGSKALEYAAKLEPQTQEVIKTTASDDETVP